MGGYLYILASGPYKTLYTGVTNSISRRTFEHKVGKGSQFTKRYDVKKLVYYEFHDRIEDAIMREKQLKKWNRNWKLELIEGLNSDWRDLYDDVIKQ